MTAIQERHQQRSAASSLAIELQADQPVISPAGSGLTGLEQYPYDSGSQLARGVPILEDPNQAQYVYSPDTVLSEHLTADLASTRWLDLLAFDAAQADKGFSLAPTRQPSPVGGNDSAVHHAYQADLVVAHTQATAQAQVSSDQLAGGHVPQHPAQQHGDAAASSYAWQLGHDIELRDVEAILFRTFAERAALWMDVCDPQKHFSTHATRLAVSTMTAG